MIGCNYFSVMFLLQRWLATVLASARASTLWSWIRHSELSTSQESAFCYSAGESRVSFSVLILVVSFTVSEVLWGNCLIDSREANSNLDRYKVFSLSSHKTFSWICSNYPWGDVILGLKARLSHLPSPLPFTEADRGRRMHTDWTKVPRWDRGRGWARHL